jgi:hypothetical protein
MGRYPSLGPYVKRGIRQISDVCIKEVRVGG